MKTRWISVCVIIHCILGYCAGMILAPNHRPLTMTTNCIQPNCFLNRPKPRDKRHVNVKCNAFGHRPNLLPDYPRDLAARFKVDTATPIEYGQPVRKYFYSVFDASKKVPLEADVNQKGLANCGMAAALTSLAFLQPDLVKDAVADYQDFFSVRLFVRWDDGIVDRDRLLDRSEIIKAGENDKKTFDVRKNSHKNKVELKTGWKNERRFVRIPLDKSFPAPVKVDRFDPKKGAATFHFCLFPRRTPRSGPILWPIIVEKSFAHLKGGYGRIEAIEPGEVMEHFMAVPYTRTVVYKRMRADEEKRFWTGFLDQKHPAVLLISCKANLAQFEGDLDEELFKVLTQNLCLSETNETEPTTAKEENATMEDESHCYGVLGYRLAGEGNVQLELLLRNPHSDLRPFFAPVELISAISESLSLPTEYVDEHLCHENAAKQNDLLRERDEIDNFYLNLHLPRS